MTEHEAIKDIQRQLWEINSEDADITLSTESLKMAIKALEELQAYKDAEEQGLLIRLPCKVGDKVWFIQGTSISQKLIETEVEKVISKKSGLYIKLFCNSFYETTCNSIGKTVFFTREEAEAKLAEMQKGER